MEPIKLLVSSQSLLKVLLRIQYPSYTGRYEFTMSGIDGTMCCFIPTIKSRPFGFNVGVEILRATEGYYSMDYKQLNKLISILSMVNDQPITLVLDTFVGVFLTI